MKLYVYPHSPISRKVLFAMHEMGLDIEREILPPYDQPGKAQLRLIYPLATVPLLILDDGTPMPESSIIVEYLDQKSAHEPRLVPRDPEPALRARAFDRVGDILLERTAYLAWALRKSAAERNEGKIATNLESVGAALTVLDTALATGRCLVGEELTLADLGAHCAAASLLTDGTLEKLDAWPNVARWHASLASRPSWRRVLEDCRNVPKPEGFA